MTKVNFLVVFAVALASAAIFLFPAGAYDPTAASSGDVRVSPGATPPYLVFACDGSTSDLESTFAQPGVIDDLKSLHAGVALDVSDMSADRARLVHRLNLAGIPVSAWLTLPNAQGHYLNSSNAPEAAAQFAEFEKWTAAYSLRWTDVGLDIEPSIQDFGAVKQGSKWKLISTLAARYFDAARVRRATIAYSALIREIQSHGYRVLTYQFPFIADARAVHSTLLERLAGILDLKSDQEVLMTYSSFNHKLDSSVIWVYGPSAQAIAVGSTMGSDSDPHFVPLNWDEFSRDVKVANHFSHTVGVYNLAGCIRQGFLSRLKTVNWSEPVTIPAESVRKAMQFRSRVQRVLWIASHLLYFIAAILIAVAWIFAAWLRRRRLRQTSAPQ